MHIFKSLLLISMISLLTACFGSSGGGGGNDDDGGGGGTSPNPDAEFRIFPVGYFNDGYREEFEVEGSNVLGNYEGTLVKSTQDQTTFNGNNVIPVRTFSHWWSVLNPLDDVELIEDEYFSLTENDRQRLGYVFLTFAISAFPSSTTAIPVKAKVGESGDIGTYTDSVGETREVSWELEAGDNDGEAKLTFNHTRKFSDDSIHIIHEFTYVIDEDGNRKSIAISHDDQHLGLLTTWEGTLKE